MNEQLLSSSPEQLPRSEQLRRSVQEKALATIALRKAAGEASV